jgi:2-methylcitrate dehydratase PrpD
MITPSSIVVPAALSIAATLGRNDATALRDAMLAGYDVMIRLGLALDGPTILYRGIWPTYIAAGFGVAAVAARLLDLDERQTANALALSLTVSSPGVGLQNAETTSRWIAAGMAARNGWLAARAAQAGFTSDLSLFEGRYFPGVFGIDPRLPALTDGLGKDLKLHEVSFKPWCAARQTMTATQAFKELLEDGLDPNAIEAIEVRCPPPFLRMIDHGIVDNDRLSRLTSQPYQLAIAAFNPEAACDIAQTNIVSDAERALMAKVTIAPDETLLDGFPDAWRASVLVRMAVGQRDKSLAHVPGDPARPFDAAAVARKFHMAADRLIGALAVDALLALSRDVVAGTAAPARLLKEIAAGNQR